MRSPLRAISIYRNPSIVSLILYELIVRTALPSKLRIIINFLFGLLIEVGRFRFRYVADTTSIVLSVESIVYAVFVSDSLVYVSTMGFGVWIVLMITVVGITILAVEAELPVGMILSDTVFLAGSIIKKDMIYISIDALFFFSN